HGTAAFVAVSARVPRLPRADLRGLLHGRHRPDPRQDAQGPAGRELRRPPPRVSPSLPPRGARQSRRRPRLRRPRPDTLRPGPPRPPRPAPEDAGGEGLGWTPSPSTASWPRFATASWAGSWRACGRPAPTR